MNRNGIESRWTSKFMAVLGLLAAGLVAGCTTEEVNAVLTGVQVVADQLAAEDDISFGDWLAGELSD